HGAAEAVPHPVRPDLIPGAAAVEEGVVPRDDLRIPGRVEAEDMAAQIADVGRSLSVAAVAHAYVEHPVRPELEQAAVPDVAVVRDLAQLHLAVRRARGRIGLA